MQPSKQPLIDPFDDQFESVSYPHASTQLRAGLRQQRALVRQFLRSDLGCVLPGGKTPDHRHSGDPPNTSSLDLPQDSEKSEAAEKAAMNNDF